MDTQKSVQDELETHWYGVVCPCFLCGKVGKWTGKIDGAEKIETVCDECFAAL